MTEIPFISKCMLGLLLVVRLTVKGFTTNYPDIRHQHRIKSITSRSLQMSASSSWSDLKIHSSKQVVGSALNDETQKRQLGTGSAFVQSKLRLFDSQLYTHEQKPKITLYRDHAGWCPYCQKTMLLIEEKQIPINIELVPMRSYGDKPTEFLRMVPNGLLPALVVEKENGQKQVITESQVIMELLDRWHPPSEGYKPMLPSDDDEVSWARYDKLARLERDLFSWWCTLLFRPEGPKMNIPKPAAGGFMQMFTGGKGDSNTIMDSKMSGSMRGFLDCLSKVDQELTSTPGPWFFGQYDYPTMIDFVYVSHVERMLASCAYWKGLDIRSPEMSVQYPGINAWLDAFEKRECYLAFKSDYYTHIKDIPPQYGPGYEGGFQDEQIKLSNLITGKEGSWSLPLPHDDPLQPLYRGPPLPLCVLDAMNITPDSNGSYQNANPDIMAKTCRQMAGWKLANNGVNVSRFAARGGRGGSKNPRKSFGAELADPYADPDDLARPHVDAALRLVCEGLLGDADNQQDHMSYLHGLEGTLRSSVPKEMIPDVTNSLAYLRDRIGVPRDLPLASARTLRAHLNWAIDSLTN